MKVTKKSLRSREDFEGRNYFWSSEYNVLKNAGYSFIKGTGENNDKGTVLDPNGNEAENVYEILVSL